MTIINFYGPPGSGKSTIALGFTSFLKSKGYNAEYVGEYIKNLIAIHGDSHIPIYNQLDILTQQNKLIKSFYDNCDYVVTDSGLLATLVYINSSTDDQIIYCRNYIKSLCIKLNNWYPNQFNILVYPCNKKELFKDSLRNYSYEESNLMIDSFKNLPISWDMEIKDFFSKQINPQDIYADLVKFFNLK